MPLQGGSSGADQWADIGYYDQFSQPQRSGVMAAVPLLTEAVARAVASGLVHPPLVLANYGCAGGANAMEPLVAGIGRLRECGYGGPVLVVHTDLPTNDFSALFDALGSSAASYEGADADVWSVAAGRSFYDQVLPGGLVTAGLCAHAVHWLSRRPGGGTGGHVSVNMAPAPLQEPWAGVAKVDWHQFLVNRARELRPGGRILVEMATRDEAGHFGAEPLYRAADQALSDLVATGDLPGGQAATMAVPVYARSEREIREPFATSEVAGVLDLERLVVRTIPDPFAAELERTGDGRAFAQSWTSTLRAFSEDQLFTGPTDRGLVNAYYSHVAEAIEDDPYSAVNDWLVADVVLRRR